MAADIRSTGREAYLRHHYGDAAQHSGGSGREGEDVAKIHDYHVTQLAKTHRRLARAVCVLLRAYARVQTCTSAHAH